MDKSIIAAGAQGDIKAFKTIFDFYLPKMRPVSLRYARSAFEAEDILQESFVKIYHNLKSFKHEGSFEGWIRRIVVNTALNYYKVNSNFYAFENIEEVNDEDINSEDTTEIEEAEAAQIMEVVNKLPEGYKMVFNLYVLEDYSHKDIAVLLGISEGSSRSQYSKARKMIKKLLSRQRKGESSHLINKKVQNERS